MPATAAHSTRLIRDTFSETSSLDYTWSEDRSSQTTTRGVSLIIPAWNEERRLPSALDQYIPLLEGNQLPFEVIVVADGVTDKTVEVATNYSGRGVRVLHFETKLGKGGAIIEGFKNARYELVGFLDADAPITAQDLALMLSILSSADAAIASRWLSGSDGELNQPISRILLSRTWNLLVRGVLGLSVYDSQCGAKFFRREAVLKVLPQVTLTNWAFDVSLLFHLTHAGLKVEEVPVSWRVDFETKMRLEKAVPAMFLSLIGIRLMSVPAMSKISTPWARWFHLRWGTL
jgi:glycosyltransferase involved in cell wall biosynthesis